MVMDVLNIQNVQRSLERLADLLAKIQKALGEYLERERASFPRFYFVGDEDLLEIIGNTKNIPRLQKHFKKMFAGIAAVLLDDSGTVIHGIASREGEEVVFDKPVSTGNFFEKKNRESLFTFSLSIANLLSIWRIFLEFFWQKKNSCNFV